MSRDLCGLRLILVRRRQEISLDVFLIVKVSAQSGVVTKPDCQHFFGRHVIVSFNLLCLPPLPIDNILLY